MWTFKIKQQPVTCSLDYFESLKTQVFLLEDRVSLLEKRMQLKLHGAAKVLLEKPVVQVPAEVKKAGQRKRRATITSQLRNDIVEYRKAGYSAKVTALKFDVSEFTVYRIMKGETDGQA